MVINMSILEKLNNLINTLESSPSELQKFVAEYEDYRNKVIFNEIKNNKEIFISPPEFSFVSDEEVDRVSMFDRETKLSNKNAMVNKINFNSLSDIEVSNNFNKLSLAS